MGRIRWSRRSGPRQARREYHFPLYPLIRSLLLPPRPPHHTGTHQRQRAANARRFRHLDRDVVESREAFLYSEGKMIDVEPVGLDSNCDLAEISQRAMD